MSPELKTDFLPIDSPSHSPWDLGPENRLAQTIAKQFESDHVLYNPILVYGPPGCGKSTFLSTLVATKRRLSGSRKIVSVSGTEFCRLLKNAIDSRSTSDFRTAFLNCRLFALDGLDELNRSDLAQQELIVLLDLMVARQCLIVLTSERIPDVSMGLASGLCSRSLAGLAFPLDPPSATTRRRVLTILLHCHQIQIPDEAMTALVELTDCPLPSQFADLERLAGQLKVLADLSGPEISAEQIKQLTSVLIATPISLQTVTRTVAKYFRVRVAELTGMSRRKQLADARGVAMYLCRLLTSESLSSIGRYYGGRDHTTVLHAVRKSANLANEEASTRTSINELRLLLARRSPAKRTAPALLSPTSMFVPLNSKRKRRASQ